MLSWTPTEMPEWRKFRGWHDGISSTSSFVNLPQPPIALPDEVRGNIATCAPFYQALRWQTELAAEGWPSLAQLQTDVSLLCIAPRHDVLTKLLAARFAMRGISSFVLDPMELGSARKQFGFIFDGPLVVGCSAELAPQVAKELVPDCARGELCLLRLVAILDEADTEGPDRLAHLGLPVIAVSPTDLVQDGGLSNVSFLVKATGGQEVSVAPSGRARKMTRSGELSMLQLVNLPGQMCGTHLPPHQPLSPPPPPPPLSHHAQTDACTGQCTPNHTRRRAHPRPVAQIAWPTLPRARSHTHVSCQHEVWRVLAGSDGPLRVPLACAARTT